MVHNNPTVTYIEEKVRMAKCLVCFHTWKPFVKTPQKCPNCQVKLISKEMLDNFKATASGKGRKKASLSQ